MEAVIYNISKFTVISLIEHLHNTIAWHFPYATCYKNVQILITVFEHRWKKCKKCNYLFAFCFYIIKELLENEQTPFPFKHCETINDRINIKTWKNRSNFCT